MRCLCFASVFLLLSATHVGAEDDCSALAPSNAENIEETFKGKIEGEIKGLIGRLAGAKADIEGEYRRLREDTLSQYNDNQRLYVWQRTIYLVCIKPDLGIDINTLLQMYMSGPPDKQSDNSQRLKELYQTAIEGVQITLMRNEEFMFPAMRQFMNDPQEINWRRVVWAAKENLEDVRRAIDASLSYDAANKENIDKAAWYITGAVEIINRQYSNKFRSVRREWNGRAFVLREIVEARNIPTPAEAKEWHEELVGYYNNIKGQLEIMLNNIQ